MKKKIIAGAVMMLALAGQVFFGGVEVNAAREYGYVDLDYKNYKGGTQKLTDEDKNVVLEAMSANGLTLEDIDTMRARIITDETEIIPDWKESTSKPKEICCTYLYGYKFYRDKKGKLTWDEKSVVCTGGSQLYGYGGFGGVGNLGDYKEGDILPAKNFWEDRDDWSWGITDQNFYELRVYRLQKGDDIEKYIKDPDLTFYYSITSYWFVPDTEEVPFEKTPFHFKKDSSDYKLSKVTGLKQSKNYFTSKITMSWDETESAMEYAVYRASTKNGKYKYLKTVEGNEISFTGLKPGSKYYYKVRACKMINGKKIYGAFSEAKSMMTRPASPKNFTVKLKNKTAKISWEKSKNAHGYDIYISDSQNGAYRSIKDMGSNKTSFSKMLVKVGKTYYFKMRAYTKNWKGQKIYSGYSKIKAVTVK